MERRSDFQGDSNLTARLRAYSREFVRYNKKWGELKNEEDFSLIYDLSDDVRLPLEEVYREGGNLAVSMISLFNEEMEDVSVCPTFTSFVSLVETSLHKRLEKSEHVIINAEQIITNMDKCPWAVKEMIKLYKRQVKILKEGLVNWVHCSKNTELYKEGAELLNLASEEGLEVNASPLYKKIPKDTKWSDVEMSLTDNEYKTLDLSIKGGKPFTVNYREMGLENNHSHKPLKAWAVLIAFAKAENNEIPSTGKKLSSFAVSVNNMTPKDRSTLFDRIDKLRKALNNSFGISEDPIPYSKEKEAYETLFGINDKSYTEEHRKSTQKMENFTCSECDGLIKNPDHNRLDYGENYICDNCKGTSHNRISNENEYKKYPDKNE